VSVVRELTSLLLSNGTIWYETALQTTLLSLILFAKNGKPVDMMAWSWIDVYQKRQRIGINFQVEVA
jgi:hypothetical protein